MSDGFDLDLRTAEQQMDEITDEEFDGSVVLGVLDGTTPPAEWVDLVLDGNVLVLSIDGDLNDLAAPFAGDIKRANGRLMHFRGFLVLAPPGFDIDSNRLE